METRFNSLHFLNAQAEYTAASLVLLGCPFDGTSSYQPGSRFAPNAIREASWALESYSPKLNRDLSEINFCDLGDLELPFGNTQRALALIEQTIDHLLNEHKVPITLGGEHLISLPIIKAVKKYYPELMVIHLDAHADLRDEYLGEQLSHGTVMRRVLEFVEGSHLIQIGIRSGTREEFLLARKIGCQYKAWPSDLEIIKQKINGHPIYLSLDLDILDPAVLPDTGTPEPGGLTFDQVIEILSTFQAAEVVGMDVVELLPQPPHQVSSIVAAKIIREALLLYFSSSSP